MDEKIFAGLLDDYIKKNFQPPRVSAEVASFAGAVRMKLSPPKKRPEEINFRRLRAERKGETFSEMLLRLIIESGEDNSVVYKRANVDRRHFSKILNNNDYQPRKKTVLAFAVALKNQRKVIVARRRQRVFRQNRAGRDDFRKRTFG